MKQFPKPQKPKRNKSYMLMVKQLRCLGYTIEPNHQCGTWDAWASEATHQGNHHSNRKASDNTTVPLCSRLHHQMHHLAGPFKGWTKERLRTWREWAIRDTREQLRKLGVGVDDGNSDDVPPVRDSDTGMG